MLYRVTVVTEIAKQIEIEAGDPSEAAQKAEELFTVEADDWGGNCEAEEVEEVTED